jgi:hypothetical protein
MKLRLLIYIKRCNYIVVMPTLKDQLGDGRTCEFWCIVVYRRRKSHIKADLENHITSSRFISMKCNEYRDATTKLNRAKVLSSEALRFSC